MKWYQTLYYGDGKSRTYKKRVQQIKNQELLPDTWIIALAQTESDLLEYYPSWQLLMPWMQDADPKIVGIAFGEPEAIEIIQHILEDVWAAAGDLQVKKYFKQERFSG